MLRGHPGTPVDRVDYVPRVTGVSPAPLSQRILVDESRPHLLEPGRGRPVRVYDWTPDAEASVPLVVVSHGTGGSGQDMGWLARPIAAAGLRVLSLDHHGNNYVDGYHPAAFLFPWERPRDVSFVLDALDPQRELRVGVAGFSAGGYTGAALVGARVDAALVAAIGAGEVELPPIEEMPDAFDHLPELMPPDEVDRIVARAAADLRDPRVAAAFLVAPGMGALLTPESLAAIDVPVEVRWGGADDVVPFEQDVRPLLERVPGVHGREVGPTVDHHDFIVSMTPDSADVRDRVGSEAAAFFAEHLLRGASERP